MSLKINFYFFFFFNFSQIVTLQYFWQQDVNTRAVWKASNVETSKFSGKFVINFQIRIEYLLAPTPIIISIIIMIIIIIIMIKNEPSNIPPLTRIEQVLRQISHFPVLASYNVCLKCLFIIFVKIFSQCLQYLFLNIFTFGLLQCLPITMFVQNVYNVCRLQYLFKFLFKIPTMFADNTMFADYNVCSNVCIKCLQCLFKCLPITMFVQILV